MMILSKGPASPRQIKLAEQIEALPRPGGFLINLLASHRMGKQLTFGQMDMADKIIKERTSK